LKRISFSSSRCYFVRPVDTRQKPTFLGRHHNRMPMNYKPGDLPKRLHAMNHQFGLPSMAIWYVYCSVSESIIPEAVCSNYETGDLLRGVGTWRTRRVRRRSVEVLSRENTENKKHCTWSEILWINLSILHIDMLSISHIKRFSREFVGVENWAHIPNSKIINIFSESICLNLK
jgi:hypothetical protein